MTYYAIALGPDKWVASPLRTARSTCANVRDARWFTSEHDAREKATSHPGSVVVVISIRSATDVVVNL